MKLALILVLGLAADGLALATPAPAVASLGLTSQNAQSAQVALVSTGSDAEASTPPGTRQQALAQPAQRPLAAPAADAEPGVETIAALLAAGMLALLAIARRRVPR